MESGFWDMYPPPPGDVNAKPQAWRHVVVRNVTGDVEQHLLPNDVHSVAKLAGPVVEFVVQPFLDVSGVEDAFLVEWKTDMLIRAWRLARRQQRLRRHDGFPLNPTRRTPRPNNLIAVCNDALFVVNRTAGVVHHLERTPEDEPCRTLCGWHFGDVRLTKSLTYAVHARSALGVLSPPETEESSSEEDG